MTCSAILQRWILLTFVILLTAPALSYVECSYSIRDDESCQETTCCECTRSPGCVNLSSRGGVTHRCSGLLEVPGRLPRPSAWMLVALLSALAGATACWIVNLLAPPPGCRRKRSMERSSRPHRIPIDISGTHQRKGQQKWTDMLGDQQHATT